MHLHVSGNQSLDSSFQIFLPAGSQWGHCTMYTAQSTVSSIVLVLPQSAGWFTLRQQYFVSYNNSKTRLCAVVGKRTWANDSQIDDALTSFCTQLVKCITTNSASWQEWASHQIALQMGESSVSERRRSFPCIYCTNTYIRIYFIFFAVF